MHFWNCKKKKKSNLYICKSTGERILPDVILGNETCIRSWFTTFRDVVARAK